MLKIPATWPYKKHMISRHARTCRIIILACTAVACYFFNATKTYLFVSWILNLCKHIINKDFKDLQNFTTPTPDSNHSLRNAILVGQMYIRFYFTSKTSDNRTSDQLVMSKRAGSISSLCRWCMYRKQTSSYVCNIKIKNLEYS